MSSRFGALGPCCLSQFDMCLGQVTADEIYTLLSKLCFLLESPDDFEKTPNAWLLQTLLDATRCGPDTGQALSLSGDSKVVER